MFLYPDQTNALATPELLTLRVRQVYYASDKNKKSSCCGLFLLFEL
jgi:hypothetical protein